MNKQELRQQILSARNSMSEAERTTKQKAIFDNLLSIPQLNEAGTILAYLAFRGEVETDEIFRWGWQAGKTMAAPVTFKEERKIIPVRIQSFEELQPGAYGILEPSGIREEQGNPASNETVPVARIDAVIIPGVAFDSEGGRLGYGGGYYDRFLPMLRSDTVKIGLAYELQVVGRLPVEEHDVHLDFLVTEQLVRKFAANT
ncbi:5-formyltetrahydrofolate cyclo-ligase [Effusibacillus consociatus]|uniref:5-formyltetrahydrofolate cyclo-ligase n=1 Tax=Effusibacillus consociatus TaxID=1117041 RepID=A0ABV9PZE2_9BACL